MLEVLNKTFLTEQQFRELAASMQANSVPVASPPEALQSEPPLPAPPPQGQLHRWTKRLRDTLGDALARINSASRPVAASQAQPDPVESTSPKSDQSEDSAQASPTEQPDTLPMFDTAPIKAVRVPAKDDKGNRRRFPRRHSECRVAIVYRSETTGLTPQQIDWLLKSGRTTGQLQNISQLGICLMLSSEIPAETEVLLRISNDQLKRSVDMSAKVLRSQAVQPGNFSIHCQTLRDFTLDELQDLGQPPIVPQVFS